MNTVSSGLRDIHLPHVSWWPPAIGWWLVAGALLIMIFAGVVLVSRYRHRARPRRAVRRELDSLAEHFAQQGDAGSLAAGLSRLMRRIALMIEPAAAAQGAEGWRAFVKRRVPDSFNDAQLAVLTEAPYRSHPEFDAVALLASARKWCEHALRTGVRGAQ